MIPDSLLLMGTMRFLRDSTKIQLHKLIQEMIIDFSNRMCVSINHDISHSSPAIINDLKLTEIIRESSQDALGTDNTIELESPSMGGEDFSFYLTHCPGVYFRIGCHNGKVNDLHTPNFDVDEKCIPTAINVLSSTITRYFD